MKAIGAVRLMRRLLPVLILLLCATDAPASVTFLQSNSSATAAVNTVNLAFSGNVTAGGQALLIACTNFGNNAAGSTYTVTDNKSGGSNIYTNFSNVVVSNASFNDLSCAWTQHSGSAQALTLTVACTPVGTCGSHTLRFAIFEFDSSTGWLGSPIDTGNTNNATAGVTTGNPGAITPAAAGELLFSAIQFGNTVSSITTTNCTRDSAPDSNGGGGWANTGRGGSCYVLNTSNTSTTATFNWATANAYSAIVTAFKPAAAPTVYARHKIINN